MNFDPAALWNMVLGALGGGGVAMWLVKRHVTRVDTHDSRLQKLELAVQNLATKETVASKDDVAGLREQMADLSSRMGSMEQLLARLDERWKVTHRTE